MTIPLDQKSIIKILGIEGLPDNSKAEILDKVSQTLQKRLFTRVMESLDEVKQTEFADLASSGNEERLIEFFKTNVKNLDDWLVEEINRMKNDLNKAAQDVDSEMKA